MGEMPEKEKVEMTEQPAESQAKPAPELRPEAKEHGAPEAQTLEEIRTELEQTRRALAQANKEAARRRHLLKQYEEAERKRKEAEMTELERAQARLKELEEVVEGLKVENSELLVDGVVRATALKMGFRNPEDALLLADFGEVEITEDRKVRGVEEALKALIKERPYLLATSEAPDIDARKRGEGRKVDEDEIARRFRI